MRPQEGRAVTHLVAAVQVRNVHVHWACGRAYADEANALGGDVVSVVQLRAAAPRRGQGVGEALLWLLFPRKRTLWILPFTT